MYLKNSPAIWSHCSNGPVLLPRPQHVTASGSYPAFIVTEHSTKDSNVLHYRPGFESHSAPKLTIVKTNETKIDFFKTQWWFHLTEIKESQRERD